MNADPLVDELLALPHCRRVRRLVEIGARSRTDPTLAELLARWETGDWQERTWSRTACWGSRDAQRAVRLSADPSRSVAGPAIRLVARLGSDADALRALRSLTGRRRRVLLLHLRRRGRAAPIDAFVRELQERGDADARRYLALASADLAASIGDDLDPVSWQRRAAGRPAETAAHLAAALDAAGQPDGLLVRAALAALHTLSTIHPDAALDLTRALWRHVPPVLLPLCVLLQQRPAAVADLVLAAPAPVAVNFAPAARRLGLERLLALLERQPATLPDPARWLRDLAPADRAALFARGGAAWRDGDGCVLPALLAVLPGELRTAEARRQLALPVLTTRPLVRASYFAFLPWDEARDGLRGWFQHPEAEMRAAAWGALTAAARYHASRLGELLGLVRQRKNEQDPVRLAFLTGLAALPPGRWAEAHLPDLAGVVREALDAPDLSPAGTHALARLLWSLLPHRPEWAAAQLAELFRQRGAVFVLPLQDRLTDADAVRVEEALAPVYERWRETNRGGWLVWVAGCLGRRLRACARLLAALRQLLAEDRDFIALPALRLLQLNLPRPEFDALAADLVGCDHTWAADALVFRHLYLHRQDLVAPFLERPYVAARKGYRDLVHLLPASGHARLTAPQQRALGRTLAGLIGAPGGTVLPRDAWTVLLALAHLAQLPAADHEALVALAAHEQPLVRDAALRALGRLDAGQGTACLLEALGDDRARVAIYALRAALADLPAARVLALLRGVPLGRVTVAKEALRLAGEFGGAAAFDWLAELDGRDLHRDVRIALLRALWDHLERPEAWAILERAAAEPDGRLLNGVLRLPAERLSAAARARAVELLLGLTRHPDPTVRVAVLQRFALLPVPDPEARPLARALALLASPLPDERWAAARAALAAATAADAGRVGDATAALLPQRRPLADWLAAVTGAAAAHPARLEAPARVVLAALRTDPLTVCWQPALAAAAEGVAGLRALVNELRATPAALHADAIRALDAALEGCAQRPDRAALAEVEAELAADADERLRRLAVTALRAAAQDGQGWTPARRERLERYRADAAPLVAGAAAFTFPPEEPAEGPALSR
jgi:hypothetical protein